MRFTWRLLLCMTGRHEPGFWKELTLRSRRIRVCIHCGIITHADWIREGDRGLEKCSKLKGLQDGYDKGA